MRSGLLVAFVVMLAAAPAAADQSVALLPLDAGKTLELYGQPVASELARALVTGQIEVQIVGPKMAVPTTASLIIDGTIKSGANGAIALSIRVRNPKDGTVFETLSATAPGLANIDRAAADLAARVVPVVRARLSALAQAENTTDPTPPVDPSRPRPPVDPTPPAAPSQLAVTVTGVTGSEALGAALTAATPAWAIGTGSIALDIRRYDVESRAVPFARARVRVVLRGQTTFDRVLVTDTVVGDKGMALPALAERVAAEVLIILRPHAKRTVPTWR